MADKKSKIEIVAEQVKKLIKKDMRYAEFSAYINDIKKNPEKNPFGSIDLLAELAEKIILLRNYGSIKEVLDAAEKIYGIVIPLGGHTENYEFLKAVFLKIFDKGGIYDSEIFSVPLYISFSDKLIYINVMNSLINIHNIQENMAMVTEYAVEVRQYYTDEQAFGMAVINAAEKLSLAQDIAETMNSLVSIAQRSAGIYDVSEELLNAVDINAKKAEMMLESAEKKLAASEKHSASYKALADSCEQTLKSISASETESIRTEASAAILDVKRAYEEMLSAEQKRLDFDKDKLLQDIISSADKKIRELRIISESIKESTSADLYRINTEANKAVERAAAMLQSDEIKSIIKDLNQTDGLIEKIIHVEEFSRKFDEDIAQVKAVPVSVPTAPTVSTPVSPAVNAIYSTPPDMTVNFFLNESIPFAERFEELNRKKEADIKENGALYHEKFKDIITAVMENSNPYIIGPSGCGKTFLVEQIASLLGIEFIDIGYINEEYDIVGFQTASGGYNYPAFYRAYKYGGIVFCDEFDNSNSRAAVKLNSFMSGGKNASYCFPNGERVMRHPNFRIIAAGNTAGSGADRNYSTREKIEESVQQRFTAMYVNYDNRLEKQILSEYPQWFDFAVQFRNATDKWSRANDCSAPGIFTTRDAATIKKYLDHRSFDDAAIIDYEFIETKDTDYLLYIVKQMEEYYSQRRPSSDIFRLFKWRVEKIADNGGIR